MDITNEKCVMIVDENLPLGLIANTAALLGLTLGKELPEIIGVPVTDQSGNEHLGLIQFPVPILKASADVMKTIREKLYQPDFQDVQVVDFSDIAQKCLTYDDYTSKMAETPSDELEFLGIALCGPKKKVNKLTGSLPLLR